MSTNTGFQNEIEIEQHLNAKKYSEINPNLRAFIQEVFAPTPHDKTTQIIHATRTRDSKYKPDLIINYAGKQATVSIKTGSGNSVHQESIYSFVDYIKTELNASADVIQALLFFHWGDGTLDGSAPASTRLTAREIIEKYPEKVVTIQTFFNNHEDELLQRFLSTGTANLSHVDWIYYGNYRSADWKNITEVYRHLKSNPSHALSVGGLNFQAYGRSDDTRRKSIQLKWGNMASYFLVGHKSITNIQSKIRGDNSHGFQNVDHIIDALDHKTFQNIPDTLKEFIFSIFDGQCHDNDIIHAQKVKKGLKGDILIWLNSDKSNLKNIAVASGAGNSVHQEKVTSFCDFLRNEIGLNDATIEQYLRFHFADGTNDNTGKISDRQKSSDYKKDHIVSLQYLERQLALHGRAILERFIKNNPDNYPNVDYFFYGNTELPYWAEIDALIDAELAKSPNQRAALAIGDFSLQSWNRSLAGTADHKRLDMQVKWNNLLQNISRIPHRQPPAHDVSANKALQGIGFEYKFTSMLNQNKQHPFWQALEITNPQVYLVNVSYNQISKIAGSKVRPKSDCYATKIPDNIDQLLEANNHILSEEILYENHISFTPIPNSGISIKLPDARNYTLQKLSYSTFKNIFTNLSPANFIAALLYTDPAQLSKNDLILATFDQTLSSLCQDLQINLAGPDAELYQILKHQAITTIKSSVNQNQRLRNIICFGDEIFDQPYSASYIFTDNQLLKKSEFTADITVTTGSGRSNGIYTLAFK